MSSEVASTASDPPVAVPVASLSNTGSAEVEAADVEAAEVETPAASSGINEVIPEVPRSASRTIRGHVRVSVRVIVDSDGTVFAALSDDPGPSRYFERLALDAAKKWTFPPTDTEAQRLVLLRFDFTRENTTARAIPLQ
jgi:TonB family protein